MNDHWRLTDDEILAKAKARQDSKDQKKQQAETKKQQQSTLQTRKLT
jgi:hypothetical protein